jgi:hypothetical protein
VFGEIQMFEVVKNNSSKIKESATRFRYDANRDRGRAVDERFFIARESFS